MSLLTMIQDVAEDLAIPVPVSVVGSTDPQIIQLLQIVVEDGASEHLYYSGYARSRINELHRSLYG